MPSSPAIVIDMNILSKVVETMGIATSVDVDIPRLFDGLTQEALKNPPQPPPLDATKKQKLVTVVRSMEPDRPVPEYTSTSGQAVLSPEDRVKKQKLLDRAKSDFNDKPPTIYLLTTPLGA